MIRAYFTIGGRVLYLDNKDPILNREGYTLATEEQIKKSRPQNNEVKDTQEVKKTTEPTKKTTEPSKK